MVFWNRSGRREKRENERKADKLRRRVTGSVF